MNEVLQIFCGRTLAFAVFRFWFNLQPLKMIEAEETKMAEIVPVSGSFSKIVADHLRLKKVD